ncbi:MAG: hypothetical protein NUK65_07595, partial [Firmicutes bacterium]|nr:hypothetical protein [Bacillota bacterium]
VEVPARVAPLASSLLNCIDNDNSFGITPPHFSHSIAGRKNIVNIQLSLYVAKLVLKRRYYLNGYIQIYE